MRAFPARATGYALSAAPAGVSDTPADLPIAITQPARHTAIRVAELAGIEIARQDHRAIAPALVQIAAHRSQLRPSRPRKLFRCWPRQRPMKFSPARSRPRVERYEPHRTFGRMHIGRSRAQPQSRLQAAQVVQGPAGCKCRCRNWRRAGGAACDRDTLAPSRRASAASIPVPSSAKAIRSGWTASTAPARASTSRLVTRTLKRHHTQLGAGSFCIQAARQ